MTAFRASALRGGFRVAIAIASVSWLAGCTGFSQVYHFQSAPAADGVPNFFRVKVEGDAQTARARFLAGFYDERAVDLYFNEVKTGNGDIRKLFEDNQKEPGDANTVIKPLTPDGARGSFVMIFSTNPKAVADTIGSFADSQLVAEALTNLLNKKEIEASRLLTATRGANDAVSTALADELAAIVPAAPAAYVVASADEAQWATRYNHVVTRSAGGASDVAIRLDNRTGNYLLKGLSFDPADVAAVAAKVTTQALLLSAQAAGVPVKTSSPPADGTTGKALAASSGALADAQAALETGRAGDESRRTALLGLALAIVGEDKDLGGDDASRRSAMASIRIALDKRLALIRPSTP